MEKRKSPLQQLSEDYRADPKRIKGPFKWATLLSIVDLITFIGQLFG
jgi:hypothetical protein